MTCRECEHREEVHDRLEGVLVCLACVVLKLLRDDYKKAGFAAHAFVKGN